MPDLKYFEVCLFTPSEPQEDVRDRFFELDLQPPSFLPYRDVLIDKKDFRECQFVFSDAEPIGSVGLGENEFELEVTTSESDDGPSEDYRLHFHLNISNEFREDFRPLIDSVLDVLDDAELNRLATYFQVDSELNDWDISGPHPEDTKLGPFYLETDNNVMSAVFRSNEETIVSIRHSDDPEFKLDNYFQEVQQYIDRDREYTQDFEL